MADLRVPDLNNIIIAGRLTRDPDLRYASSGTAFCRLGIANTRYYKKDGVKNEESMFIDAVCWDKTAEFIGEKLRKGRPVLVEGRVTMNSWEDKDTGEKRSKLEINAQRITPLDWDEDKPAGPGDAATGKSTNPSDY